MGEFIFRVCEKSEVHELMRFMSGHLGETHLFATDKAFVDYFFYNKRTGKYNAACCFLDGEIVGAAAFITISHYDEAVLPKQDFAWVTNWVASAEVQGKGVGRGVYRVVVETVGCTGYGAVGQNDVAERLYKKAGFEVDGLVHYYQRLTVKNHKKTFKKLCENDIMSIEPHNRLYPAKTARYIINKYLKSPYYDYTAYGGDNYCIIVKEQRYPKEYGKKCLRLVEFFGDTRELNGKHEEFQALLDSHGAEYIDFYCIGPDENLITGAGFLRNNGQELLPNYFEPFVNKNIEIRYAYKIEEKPSGLVTAAFKGDSDREFPRERRE